MEQDKEDKEKEMKRIQRRVLQSEFMRSMKDQLNIDKPLEESTITQKAYTRTEQDEFEEKFFIRLQKTKKQKQMEKHKAQSQLTNDGLFDFRRDKDLEAFVTLGEMKQDKRGKKRKKK